MKLSEALAQVKAIKPSQFDDTILTAWVSELDGQLHDTIMYGREAPPALEAPYDLEADAQRELLVSFPYDQIYVSWLCAKIDFANQEFDRYNNNMSKYNEYHDAFSASYAREHSQTSAGEAEI